MRRALSRGFTHALVSLLLLGAALAFGCGDRRAPAGRDLPHEWYSAETDARTGGRYLDAARGALRARQRAERAAKSPVRYESDRIAEFRNVRVLLEEGYTVHRLPRPTAAISYTNVLTTRRHVYVRQYTRYAVESPRQAAIDERARRSQQSGQTELAARLMARPVETAMHESDAELEEANRQALGLFAKLLPGRGVVPVNSDETNETHGSWHCLSHEIPRL